MTIIAPPSALEACVSPDPATVVTVTDLAAHSVAQEAVIQSCEAKRRALVEVIGGGNVR
ncbi:MAG: hypothetical protein AAGC58_04550 [Asticcacaulis sp.]